MYILHSQHISIWTGYISNAGGPHVASGYHIGSCSYSFIYCRPVPSLHLVFNIIISLLFAHIHFRMRLNRRQQRLETTGIFVSPHGTSIKTPSLFWVFIVYQVALSYWSFNWNFIEFIDSFGNNWHLYIMSPSAMNMIHLYRSSFI